MCEVCGYQVTSLARIRIMNIQLGRLKPGDYRNVTEKEVEELMDQIQQSKHVVVKNKTLPEKNEAFANKASKVTRKSGVYQSNVSKKSYRAGKPKEKSVAAKKSYGEGRPKEKSVAGKKSYGEGKPKEKSVAAKKSYGEGKPKVKSVADRQMGNKRGSKNTSQRNKKH